jgi:hypothetical protein
VHQAETGPPTQEFRYSGDDANTPEHLNTRTPSRYVLPETTLLAVIGCVDLLSTIYLVATQQAIEANPLMSGILRLFGPLGFIAVKALLLAVPLTIVEIARPRHPRFVRSALRFAIVLYLGIYAVAFLRYDLLPT